MLNIQSKKTNKILAFSQRRIPYIPELKRLCGSVSAVIIMMQLEYRFASHPDGFYKFLKPCEHRRYVTGDSWCEELSFTEHEFRTGFDKIGIRYKSKKQLRLKNANLFENKFYLSYIDVREGLTYYHRNHTTLDHILDNILLDYTPKYVRDGEQPVDFSGDADCAFPEINNPHLQKLGLSTSRNADSAFPYINTNITQRRTAEAVTKKSKETKPSNNIAAAEIVLGDEDKIIGENLTLRQEEFLKAICAQIFSEGLTTYSQDELFEYLSFEVLNLKSFERAGNLFEKKINTIKSLIKKGRWSKPAELVQQQKKEVDEQTQQNIKKMQELKSNLRHWKKLEKVAKEKKIKESENMYQNLIAKCENDIKELQINEQSRSIKC